MTCIVHAKRLSEIEALAWCSTLISYLFFGRSTQSSTAAQLHFAPLRYQKLHKRYASCIMISVRHLAIFFLLARFCFN